MRHPLLALTCATLIIGAFSPALAQTNSSGISLRWDTCYGEGGLENKVFACDTNDGSETLVVSFHTPQPLTDFGGVEVRFGLKTDSATVPPWWMFLNSGSCRQTAMGLNGIGNPAWTECVDPWQGGLTQPPIASLATWQILEPDLVDFDTVVATANPSGINIQPGVEYFACNLVIHNTNTVGTGACGGCQTPVCFEVAHMDIGSPTLGLRLRDGYPWTSSKTCVWQNGVIPSFQNNPCTDAICLTYGVDDFTCSALDVTPARRSTWGLIKTLYR